MTKLAAVIRAACVAAAATLVVGAALHLKAGCLARGSSIAAHVGGGRAVNSLVILIATWCVAHRHCHTRAISRPPARHDDARPCEQPGLVQTTPLCQWTC